MSVQALDKRMTFGMFVKGIGKKLQSIMARSISPEEKMDLILSEMEKDTQEKRVTARGIRAQMVAIADEESEDLEPLERMKSRRGKMGEFGAKILGEKEAAEKAGDEALARKKNAQLAQVAQEIKALGATLSSMESSYVTLKEAYEVAMENYRVALASYEHIRQNGRTMLMAIKAHQDALKVRDKTKTQPARADASFLDDLTRELSKAKGELRSDRQIDMEMDATNSVHFETEEQIEADAAIVAELRKAQKKV